MCGIFFSLSKTGPIFPDEAIVKALKDRGPDSYRQVIIRIPIVRGSADQSAAQLHAVFCSSVLALRGEETVEQPLIESKFGSILCWNGEAWKLGGKTVNGNDTEAFLSLLVGNSLEGIEPTSVDVLEHVASIQGPFAYVFYDPLKARILFARDCLGRRSLLRKTTQSGDVIISSIGSASTEWVEIGAEGTHQIQLPNSESASVGTWEETIIRRQKSPFPPLNKLTQSSTFATEDRSIATAAVGLLEKLTIATRLRVSDLGKLTVSQASSAPLPPARLAILFSGGLDCTVLAKLAHDLIPTTEPIDLLNVAFQNPRVEKVASQKDGLGSIYDVCPDRITARKSAEELRRVRPNRIWRLIEVNVPYVESQAHRIEILHLMSPHNTEMDLSISYAFFFAARGTGTAYGAEGSQPQEHYTSAARILLSGLGADELFGGYQRHATAFSRNGYQGLNDELELDFQRLGKRNLGRDDRIISRWGKEVRYPYLDEEFVAWALELPASSKCGCETVGDGEDELGFGKRVLRVAAQVMGLEQVAKEKKRAIQFGARTAKMEVGGGKIKGHLPLTV